MHSLSRVTVALLTFVFWVSLISQSALAAPPVPTELQAMQLLYGRAYKQRGSVVKTVDKLGMRVNKEPGYNHTILEYVTPWKIATVTLDGKTYFIATGQGHAVSDPNRPEDAAHVQSAYISAIWFTLEDGRWVPAGKQLNLAADGSFGQVNGKPWSGFPQMAPLENMVLLAADEGGYMNQGYSSSWYPVYAFDGSGFRYLGAVSSGGSNGGAGAEPEIAFSGTIIAANKASNGQLQLTLSYSGTTVLAGKPVKLDKVRCNFLYRADPKRPGEGSFEPATEQCRAIVQSASF